MVNYSPYTEVINQTNKKQMNQKYIPLVITLLIIIVGGGIYAYNRSQSNKLSSNSAMMDKDQLMYNEDSEKTEQNMMDNDTMYEDSMMASSRYQIYSTEAVKTAQQAGKTVVLFFHATWCPECKAADKAFKSNLDSIPENVVILKTDYDSNTELKKKYGVTYQHTFVQIDNNGNKITSWISGDVEMLKKNIK